MGNKSSKQNRRGKPAAPPSSPDVDAPTAPTSEAATARPLPVPSASGNATSSLAATASGDGEESSNQSRRPSVHRKKKSLDFSRFPPSELHSGAKYDPECKSSVTGILIKDIKTYYQWTRRDQLGKGHFGKVYRAVNKQHGYTVALKAVSKRGLRGSRLASLQNEINIMKLLKHENIVHLYEVLEDSSNVYFAIELCTGGELFDAITNAPDAHFNEGVAACIAKDLLDGIRYCHEQNVAHRDLKPENIILEDDSPPVDGRYTMIKLIDFGLSRIYEDDKIMSSRVGTPYYIAPEVLQRNYGPPCDLWSAGIIIYILLCGYPPFRGENDQQIYHQIEYGDLEFCDDPDEKIWSIVSDDAIDLLKKLIVRDPAKRLTAAEAMEHKWIVELGPKDPPPLPSTVMRRLKRFSKENAFKRAAKSVIAGLLPSDEITSLRAVFDEFDLNKDGNLTIDELKQGLGNKLSQMEGESKKLKTKSSSAHMDSGALRQVTGIAVKDAQSFLDSLDVDGDGVVNVNEFIAATMEEQQFNTRKRMLQAFEKFDNDGDMILSVSEIKKALGSDKIAEEILKRFDKDGDGAISFEEFKAVMNDEGDDS